MYHFDVVLSSNSSIGTSSRAAFLDWGEFQHFSSQRKRCGNQQANHLTDNLLAIDTVAAIDHHSVILSIRIILWTRRIAQNIFYSILHRCPTREKWSKSHTQQSMVDATGFDSSRRKTGGRSSNHDGITLSRNGVMSVPSPCGMFNYRSPRKPVNNLQ